MGLLNSSHLKNVLLSWKQLPSLLLSHQLRKNRNELQSLHLKQAEPRTGQKWQPVVQVSKCLWLSFGGIFTVSVHLRAKVSDKVLNERIVVLPPPNLPL